MDMRLTSITAIGLAWLAGTLLGADSTALKTDQDKLSYGLGYNYGQNLKVRSVELNLDLFVKGYKDASAGAERLLTDQEVQEVLANFSKEMRAKQEAKNKELAEKNKKEGEAFLAENAKKPGVTVLPSGLQYKVLTEGTGETPKLTDRVSVQYRGTLIDGTTEFDSSYKRGKPGEFSVSGVVKGWTEALQLMKAGAKWQLFIPSGLAYGERGRPGIPPNSTLLFEMELLAVMPGAPTPPPPPSSPPVTSDIIKVPSAEELKKGAKIEVIKAEDAEKLKEAQEKEKGKPKE